ncbi:hypothetical protein [Deinococcus altitudinis]|uniref:hypothetical protein n=1 Tax=Deinococcus altitudinis TaxID=468914 RepID=UPI003892C073
MPPKWTPIKAAYHLGEAYAAEQGIDADYSLFEVELIARAMDADPEYLKGVWAGWVEELEGNGLTGKQIDEVWYWLDTSVIGGLANP